MISAFAAPGRNAAEERAKLAEARRLFFEFYRPLQTHASERERAFLETGEELGIEFGGGPIVARGWGRGPLLVFFHGLLGRGAQFRAFVEAAVPMGFRAVVFDVPGNGGSAATAIHGDQMVHVVDRIVEIEGSLPHAVVAHSLGCSWALHITRQGILPGRIVCISPIADRELALERYAQMHGITPDVGVLLRRMFAGFEGADICAIYDPIVAVSSLEVPGLVLHGSRDDFIDPENGRLLARSWPGAEFVLVDGRGHFDILEDAKVIRTAVEFATRP